MLTKYPSVYGNTGSLYIKKDLGLYWLQQIITYAEQLSRRIHECTSVLPVTLYGKKISHQRNHGFTPEKENKPCLDDDA